MAPALAAAHIGHEIEHSSAMAGFLIGAAAGLAVGVLAVATVATGGAALAVVAAVGGAVAATGGGALAGMYIGAAHLTPKGPISTGSDNVFYGPARIPAARAIVDTVACRDHGTKFLATGSDSVFINEYPAVRKEDKSECDGTVKSEFDNIFIGAETAQYLEIDSEVPEWMVNVAMGMVIVGGTVALVFGAAAAVSAAGLCGLINFAGTAVGSMIGSAVLAPVGGMIGEALGGELGSRIGEVAGGLLGGFFGGGIGNRMAAGHPVDVASGELFTAQVDFTITGLVAIPWERLWMSSSTQRGSLGAKWHHPLDMALTGAEGFNLLRLEHGRLILLPDLQVGQGFHHRAERLVAFRRGRTDWTIRRDDGLTYRLAAGHRAEDPLRLIRIEDDNGNRVTLEHDEAGHLCRVTGTDGILYLFATDDAGRIKAIDRSDGESRVRLVGYDYDRHGDLIAATDRSGVPFRYEYRQHLMVRETRRSGLSFYFEWDDPALATGARCTRTWGDGQIYDRRFTYAPAERRTTVRNQEGATETYRYDRIGMVTEVVTPLGAHSGGSYNRFGEMESATDPNGAVTSWRRDGFGRVTAYTERDGATWRYAYAGDEPARAGFWAVAAETDPLGFETLAEYDLRGNLVAYRDASGHHVRILRDPRGLPLNLQDDEGTLARFSWTEQGNLRERRMSRGGAIRFEHDRLGRLIRETVEGSGPVDYSYDALDRLTGVTRGDGTTATAVYDADDRLVELQEQDGQVYRWEYRGLPDPVLRINPDGSRFSYDYDRELNLVGLRNEAGDEYRLDYDADQRLTGETGFDGRRQEYAYDPAGHAIRMSDGARVHAMTRDAAGRLLRRDSSDGEWAAFTYDAAGRLVGADNAHRKLRMRHDPRGLLLGETQDGLDTSHSYSPRGERVATLLPDGRILRFGYDRDGLFDRLSFGGRDILNLRRDRMGREESRIGGGLRLRTEYDPQGRIARQLGYRENRQAPVFGRSYGYDRAGLISRISDLARGESRFHYDQRERLRRVTGSREEVFAFDPAGNILAGAEQVRDASIRQGRLQMRGDNHYEYDDAGNRIRLRRGQGGAHVFTYGYDALNQLTTVHEVRGRTRRETRFAYDALGRRISKSHREVMVAANDPGGPDPQRIAELVREDTTWFLWNGDVLLAEGRGDGTGAPDPTAVVYVFEPDSFRPAAQIRRHSPEQEGEVLIYWTDHLGTPQEVSNERGELVWQVALKAWGGIDRVLHERVENNIRFQGQYHDPETGLHYNRFRHYDPAAGCFVNPDPIGLSGGAVLAGYALNPVHWVDPLGLTDWDDYRTKNQGRGWTPRQMAANYRKTNDYKTRHAPSAHGNSLSSNRPAVLYVLVDEKGNFQKWGITQEGSVAQIG